MKTCFLFLSTIALFSGLNNSKASPGTVATWPAASTFNSDTTIAITSDTQFLITAYNTGMFEIKACKLARRQTGDRKVRKFAIMFLADQEARDKDLLALLTIKGCSPPTQLPVDLEKQYQYLNEWMGNDFNRKYTTADMEAQKSAIAMYSSASLRCKDADIRRFAKGVVAQLQMQEDSAQSLLVHINRPHPSGW